MKNRTEILCIFVYAIFFIAAFSMVLSTNVNNQINDESVGEGDNLVNQNGATLEMGLESQYNANMMENSDGNIYYHPCPTEIYPQPLNQDQQIANAGPDQTVDEGVVVQFDGTGSYDPYGTIESYEWDFDANVDSDEDGNYTNDIDAIGPTPTHIYGDDGVYNVTLTVRSVRSSGGSEKVDQDVVLIIDSSGSMQWNDPDDIRIDAAKHYVYMLTPEDKVAVVDFDSDTKLLQGLTMDYYAAMNALNLIDSVGGTKLSPALDKSITELEDYGESEHTWAIILLTDAENLAQGDRDDCYFQANRAYNDSIVVFTIGLNIDTPKEQKLLEDIANITGGKYYSPPNASHLYSIYENISEQVENTTSEVMYDSDDVQITVQNVAPAIGSYSITGGDEGIVIDYDSTATDPGSDDLTFTWNWGDGTSDTVTIYYNDGAGPDPYPSPDGTYPFSANDTVQHTYGDNGIYTITLSVEDDDLGSYTRIQNVTINNVAPTINFVSLPTNGDEGALLTYSSKATDQGSDDLTFTWNWGDGTSDTVTIYYNDGVGPDPTPSPWGTYPFSATDTVDHIYGDNGIYTITLSIEDDDLGAITKIQNVTIDNVAPSINFVSVPTNGDEGVLLTYSSKATDQGSDDLTFTWNWGDGSSDTITIYYNDGVGPDPYPSPWGTFPFSATDIVQHTYGDNGNYSITLTVEDDDNGVVTKTETVEIYNVAPIIDIILVPGDGDEGALLLYSSSATDPGSDDLTFTWDWGDGTSDTVTIHYNDGVGPDPYPSPWGIFPFSVTDMADHVYGDNWNYTITLTVKDDDNGITVNTTSVTIYNVAPSIDIVGSLKMFEGSPVDLIANSTDPGSDDLTFTWEFELGPTIVHVFYNDGIGPDPLPSPLGIYPFTVTDTSGYLYGDNGNFTITLTVEDDDGGSTTDTWIIEVQNVAPSVEVEAYVLVDFTLRIAGEKWHDVRLYIYEDDVEVGYAGVVRHPGSPDDQSVTISNVKCHITTAINATVYYTPDDDPINGQRNGANPCWIKIGFEDGSYEILKHTFNVRHPETWEWNIGMNHYFVGHKITFKAKATDPGSDDLTFNWNWGDGSPKAGTTHYNDGLGPDPYPSPWGIYPCAAMDLREHSYTTAGNYIAILTVTDDDGGITVYTITIKLS